MTRTESAGATGRARLSWRSIPWIGGIFIAGISALAACDIVRSHGAASAETSRELDTQARVIAEQTVRSLQAVDLVLRQIADERAGGVLGKAQHGDLQAYLRQQAAGLVQIEGLALFDAQGRLVANSLTAQPPDPPLDVAGDPLFASARDSTDNGLRVEGARRGLLTGQWIFPIARRLHSGDGRFAGVILAGGRVEHYQDFYRDVRLDAGTAITLLHRDGSLVARHPSLDGAIGQRYPVIDAMLELRRANPQGPLRSVSPVDGVERFSALAMVAGQPLAVVVTRDVGVALAPWRQQAIGTIARTLALGALAALLLAMLQRQFARLERTRASLEVSRERFALAAAGSDEGIWDWDVAGDRVYVSARAREIFGAPPGPDVQPRAAWYAGLKLHPDDQAAHTEAMQHHMAGRTLVYAGEYRVQHPDGSWRWVRVHGLCVRDAHGAPLRMAGSVADIDSRRRAEIALRTSEQRFALAVAGSDDGVWEFDYVNDRVYASRRGREVLGVSPEPEIQTLEQWNAELQLHPDDAVLRQAAMQAHLDGKVPAYEGEWRVRQPDGRYRWVRVRGVCKRDAAGKPLRMAGSVSDIDARKRAEDSLRRSEERYALAVAGSDDGVWDWDLVAGEAFESARAREIQGLPPGPEVQPINELVASLRVHPDDAPCRAEGIRAHLAGETPAYECEYRVHNDDGSYRWIRVHALCLRDASGKPYRMAGSVSDIDAQKRAEEALRRSEERYQLAVAGSNEGLWDWDLASDMLFLSPRAQRLTFLEPGEPLRPRDEWIAATTYHPDDVPHVRQAIVDHLRGATPYFAVEYRLRHHSGQWHWYRQRGVAVRDGQGRPTRMAGSMEDITDRKSAEAERDRLETQLRQAQKLEAIGTLAGGIAHDFNNILAAILGYGEMAQRDAAVGSAQRRHIDAALSAGMRAKSLVERILAFSRSGMGERVPVHVQSVVMEALEQLQASLPAGITLQRRLDAGDAAVLGDPTQVHQVVANLCANAVQAMKSRGTLTVELDRVQLSAPRCATSVLADGAYVRLSVRDTGVGIAAPVLERIFDPFFTTKEAGVGTGLGLSLVHGIVTDLGGGIDVQSRPGEGATFTVYLPWQSSVAAPAVQDQAVPEGAGETVLLVDDEEALVRLGEEMIASLGYEPIGFTSSAAALEAFRAAPGRFDAVLSDEAMPEMTGSELARAIRLIRQDIPIVLMSGYVTPALAQRAREAGVQDVLAKPLVSSDIARSLAGALQD